MGLPGEETLREALAAGPDVLTFSTDKLFGACQGGLLLVAPHLAEAFRNNPLLRALRVDKVTYALLGAALDLYRRGRTGSIPALAMLATSERTLRARALKLKRDLERRAPGRFEAACWTPRDVPAAARRPSRPSRRRPSPSSPTEAGPKTSRRSSGRGASRPSWACSARAAFSST